jgi:uncharacterized membrane protein
VKELGFQRRKRMGICGPWKVVMVSLSVSPVQGEDVERYGGFSPLVRHYQSFIRIVTLPGATY